MGSKEHKSRKRKATGDSETIRKKGKDVGENEAENVLTEQQSDTEVPQKGLNPFDNREVDDPLEDDPDITQIPKETPIRFEKQLDLREFRRKLRTYDFIYELRHFIHLNENSSRDMVAKFLEKKGRPLELIEAFQRIDLSSLHQISYLAEALRIVLERVISDFPQEKDHSLSACRYFVKSYSKFLQQLIKSPIPNHRRTCIGLITAISTFVPELIRQLLACFDGLASHDQIDRYLSHSKREVDQPATVRQAFVQFILSLLVNGSTFVVRVLLDKYELIATCFHGLEMDDPETVVSVLTAFKKCVLESLLITKTKKIRVFDRGVIRSLVNLYEWKGPAYFAAKHQKSSGNLEKYIDPESQQLVRQCVTDFLILLLSNRKYGLAFDTMTHFKQRKNEIQQRTLPMLRNPWNCELKSRLVIAILSACPELAEGSVKNCSYRLMALHRSEPTEEAIRILGFIGTIVDEMSPTVMRAGLEQITLTHFTAWIKELCLPSKVLEILKMPSFIKADDPARRLATIKTLLAMFRQYCNYMTVIIEREKFKGNDLRKFRFDMLEHLLLYFPTVENILLGLFLSIDTGSQDEKIAHMNCAFDLLTYICKANRTFVNKTGAVIDYIKLLYPFFEEDDDERLLVVKLKGMKLLMLLSPTSIQPTEDAYYNVIENLSLLLNKDQKDTLNVRPILQKLLVNSNMFDNGPLEVDIWLEAMKFVDAGAMVEVAKCWQELKERKVDMSQYLSIDFTSKNSFKSLFRDIENDVSVEGYMDIPVMSKCLVAMLETRGKWPKCSEYFELIAFLLYHFIPAPHAIQQIYGDHYSKFYKYMMTWLDKQKPGKLVAATVPGFNEMYVAILQGQANFSEIFPGDHQFNVGEKEMLLDPNLQRESYVMLLVYQISFVVSQLARKGNLERIQAEAASYYLIGLLQILRTTKTHEIDDIEALETNTKEEASLSYIEQALRYIYCRHLPLLQSFNAFGSEKSDGEFIKFICDLTQVVNQFKIDEWDYLTVNYRDKLVNQILTAITTTLQNETIPDANAIVKVLETFQMSDANCTRILGHLSQLSAKHLVSNNAHTIYYEILVYALNRLAALKKCPQNSDIVVASIGSVYVQLITRLKTEASLEKLEESFWNFLSVSHQCIELITKDVFLAIFGSSRITKSTVKFAALLLKRRKDLIGEFLAILPENLATKELTYPLLNVVVRQKIDLPRKLRDTIYKEYKNGIMKTIEKPQKAAVIYRENVEISIDLIEQCLAVGDFYKKASKSEAAEVFQLRMIEAIFEKELQHYAEKPDVQCSVFIAFLQNVLNLFLVAVKRDAVEKEKILAFSYTIYNWIKTHGKSVGEGSYDEIKESQMWQNFCKTCLKLGMRGIEENGQEIVGSEDQTNSEFLKLLAYLIDQFYARNGEHPHAGHYFEMITSHSRFFDIALTQSTTLVKTHLMHLMLVLAQKNHSVMDEKHLPILLGAYHARLSTCDRYTLALLQLYEQSGVDCSKYRPFIWGEHAIDHYSLKSAEEQQIAQHDLSITQIMLAVERSVSDFTVTNYPIWRRLNTLDQLPEVEFTSPYRKWRGYGRSELERKIESGQSDFDQSFLKLHSKDPTVYDECYDPAFILPLIAMSVSPGVYLHPVRPVQNGLLGIAFAALSSLDKEMRLAAGLAHLRYRDHFENNKFLDKSLWIQAYDNIQTGLEQLQQRWSKHKKAGIPRVPYVSGLFLAVSMTTLIDPIDPMYKVLSMYLRVKSTFNFLCVPEFNVLFQSPEIEHLTYRQFIVDIIRNGIKCSSDLFLLVTTGTFKALMAFYNSTMSNLDTNLRILSVINVCARIPGSVKLMIDHIGVVPWLNAVIDSAEYFHFDTIEALISIVSNLWYAAKAVEKSPNHFVYIELRLFQLLVKLTPLVSNRLSVGVFTKFLNILAKTANGKHQNITEEMLNHIVNCARRHFPEQLWYIENLRQFGTNCLESEEAYCENLKLMGLEDMQILALSSLRNFVKRWKEGKVETGSLDLALMK